MKDDLLVGASALVTALFAWATAPARAILDDVALAPYFDEVELQSAGDAVLWIDQEGNLAVRLPVEQVVFFDPNGAPIGAGLSERCARSASSSLRPSLVVCLSVDDLAPK